jgi:hypothetical protein
LSLASCGARSAVELIRQRAAGGSESVPEPPQPLPSQGGVGTIPGTAGASAQAGTAPGPPLEEPDPSVSPDADTPPDASIPADASIPDATIPPDATAVLDASPKPPCESISESIDELRPGVMLVVDQSRSMRTAFPQQGSPDTRWSLVGKALFDPSSGVVKTYEGSIRFGIAFFTGNQNGECPVLHEAHAATQNYTALNALYQSLAPDGSTPTGESLNQVIGELERRQRQNVRTIVLVTDGNPNTCFMQSGSNGQFEAVEAVQLAYELGYDTYVLGISRDIAGANLQQLANAGAGKLIDLVHGVDPDAAQPYQASSDKNGLTAQFADILSHVSFCDVRTQRDVAPDEASQARVLLDGKPLAYDASDGFRLKDARHIEITGSACDAIKAGAKQLSVRISCE